MMVKKQTVKEAMGNRENVPIYFATRVKTIFPILPGLFIQIRVVSQSGYGGGVAVIDQLLQPWPFHPRPETKPV